MAKASPSCHLPVPGPCTESCARPWSHWLLAPYGSSSDSPDLDLFCTINKSTLLSPAGYSRLGLAPLSTYHVGLLCYPGVLPELGWLL